MCEEYAGLGRLAQSPSPLWHLGRLLLTISLLIGAFSPGSTVYAGAIPVDGNKTITDAGLNGAAIETPDLVIRGNERYAVWADKIPRRGYIGLLWTRICFSPNPLMVVKVGARMCESAPATTTTGVIIPSSPWPPMVRFGSSGISFISPIADQTNEIRLAKSVDGGATFTVTTLVDGFPEAEDRWLPRIAVGTARRQSALALQRILGKWQQHRL